MTPNSKKAFKNKKKKIEMNMKGQRVKNSHACVFTKESSIKLSN